MPDTTAPADVTSPAPTPPAPASPAPVPQGPERSLAEYMADHMAQVQRNANRSDKIEAAPASAAPVEAATSPAVSVETPAASESSAETTAAPTAPTPPVDERAQALAEYIRGKRPFSYLVKLVVVVLAAMLEPFVTGAAVAVAYALSGPASWAYRAIWHRPAAA